MAASKNLNKHESKVADKVVERLERFEHRFKSKMSVLVISALGLIAALMWNEAVKEIIALYSPAEQKLIYQITAASVITVFAVIVTVMLSSSEKEVPEIEAA